MKNHKPTKPAFNVGPSQMAFRWLANDGPLLVLYGSSLLLSPHQNTPKTLSELDPLWQNFLDPRMHCSAIKEETIAINHNGIPLRNFETIRGYMAETS